MTSIVLATLSARVSFAKPEDTEIEDAGSVAGADVGADDETEVGENVEGMGEGSEDGIEEDIEEDVEGEMEADIEERSQVSWAYLDVPTPSEAARLELGSQYSENYEDADLKFWSEQVVTLHAPNKEKYTTSVGRLVKESRRFRRLFAGTSGEEADDQIGIDGDSEAATMLCRWLSDTTFEVPVEVSTRRLPTILELYLLAAEYKLENLQNKTMDTIRAYYRIGAPHEDRLARAYAGTKKRDPMRKFLMRSVT